jgi:large subunit ribosomal protein L13
MKRTSTYFPKPGVIADNWRVIDASGKTLGRISRDIAVVLQGKDKPTFTPHVITGDHVVVLNADKVRVTGRKLLQKMYYRHSGYVGNLKTMILRDMLQQHPERVIQLAVKGMLPRNHQGRQMLRRLKVYAGDQHPHEAQVRPNTEQSEGQV